ncbi:formylglycine-generating enzyme family protein [Glaciecola sp. MF2-115]|uniref:formylglycine-generating enzyme family protein n=1 Tax=Glaciecola sp. MF2-115 TaxID=3384827 RepID=UPI0039A3BA08
MSKLLLGLLVFLCLFAINGCTELPKGTVEISTSPIDAVIYIDGVNKGNSASFNGKATAFSLKVTEGEHIISAIKPTGGPREFYAEKTIVVSSDSIQTVFLELEQRESPSFIEKAKSTDHSIEVVNIPAGSFLMGSDTGAEDEASAHEAILSAFAMSKYEITFAQWDACYALKGCTYLPNDEGWGRGKRPVINVSFNDITTEFIPWLNKVTSKKYRLPTETEWEYAARANSLGEYSWGDEIGNNKANCNGCGSQWDNKETAPVGSFNANEFGLFDMHGNVWELTQDCYSTEYPQSLPWNPKNDGSAKTEGRCEFRVWRGGSWSDGTYSMRSRYRLYDTLKERVNAYGFRLVQE